MDCADYDNRNIVLNELIGLRARVVRCSDMKQKGLEGIITDETKNTLRIETDGRSRTVVKAASVFRFYTQSRSFLVEGREINFRPHERIEKAMKFYKRRKL